MASPGPPLKKCKRVRKANVKYEDDLPQAAPEPAETQEDAEPAEGRRASRRARLSRGNDEAGPSTQPAPSRRAAAGQQSHLASPDELAHMIRQRDFYKAEAEEAANPGFTETEKEELVGAVMRHMLFKQQQKPDQPVRREDLAKLLQGGGSYIIAAAQAKFASAFGLEMKLVELMPAKMAGKSEAELRGQDIKTTKGYVMRSLLPPKCRSIVRKPNVNDAFAMFVLSLIDLAPSKKLSEEELWEHLDSVCLHKKKVHPTLGKPDDQIAAMLKKRYIMEVKPGAADGPILLYCAGENAMDEIPQDEMKQFADKALREAAIEIQDDSPPETEAE